MGIGYDLTSSEKTDEILELQRRLGKAEAALERAERLATAGRFGAEMIHEINNPLEAITNLLYLFKSQPLPASALDFLEMMDEQIRRINVITRQTLSFHRTADKPLRADLVELLKIAIRTYSHKIAEKEIKLELDLPIFVECEVYPGELTQVFSNLISNSIDASDRGGLLRIRLRSAPNHVSITVCDAGCGIPPAIRNSLFEAFSSGKEKGNGLGLWICRRIVEKHGGHILWRSSTRPERSGTAFRISLDKSKPEQVSFPEGGSSRDDSMRKRITG